MTDVCTNVQCALFWKLVSRWKLLHTPNSSVLVCWWPESSLASDVHHLLWFCSRYHGDSSSTYLANLDGKGGEEAGWELRDEKWVSLFLSHETERQKRFFTLLSDGNVWVEIHWRNVESRTRKNKRIRSIWKEDIF